MAPRWKQLRDFPDYKISDTGLIWSDKTKTLLHHYNHQGTLQIVLLRPDGKQSARTVARLVLSTFAPSQSLYSVEVAFRDGDSLNVDLSNLYWISKSKRVLEKCYSTKPRKGHARRNFERLTDPNHTEPTYD